MNTENLAKNKNINLKKELQDWLLLDTGKDGTYLDDICMLIMDKATKGDLEAIATIKDIITDKTLNLNVTITINSQQEG